MQSKNIIIAVLVLVLVGAIGALLFIKSSETTVIVDEAPPTPEEQPLPVEPDGGIGNTPGAKEGDMPSSTKREAETLIGESTTDLEIRAYHFGSGKREIVLIGGVHGGYSPNTSKLAEEFIKYYTENESAIPENLTLTIIPTLNPDGAEKSGAEGRFNDNKVDLNRNFDCEWSATAIWQNKEVSGGSAPFSEPESVALRNYIELYEPVAAIVLFGAEGKVYPSACGKTPSKASVELAATYATAAGYPAQAEFDAYAITGDMVNWMAGQGIPAISVLLSDYKNTEWEKNLAGMNAVLTKYAE